MPAPKIRADYDQLTMIAAAFGRESDSIQSMNRSVKGSLDTLRGGDWIGPGATKFYEEMDSAVLPSLQRLQSALGLAQRVTNQIRGIAQQSEQEAAAVLRGRLGAGGGALGSGGPGEGAPGAGNGSGGGLNSPASGGGDAPAGEKSPWSFGKFGGLLFGDGLDKSQKGKLSFTDSKGKDSQAAGVKLNLATFSAIEGNFLNDHLKVNVLAGEAGLQLGVDDKGEFKAGGFIEGAVARVRGGGLAAGSTDLGFTAGFDVKALSGEAFAGIKEGSLGAKAGANLASVKGETGFNILGYNISLGAEAGFKLEAGVQVGAKNEIAVGPFSISLGFSKAKT